jgi:hypothetical protein
MIVKKYQEFLDRLLVNKEFMIKFTASDGRANTLAHNLRSAIKATQSHDDFKEKYAGLDTKYKIRVVGTLVVCELRNYTPSDASQEKVNVNPLEKEKSNTLSPDKQTFKEVDSLFGIVGAITDNFSINSFIFPSIDLTPIEIEKLNKWAEKKNIRLLFGFQPEEYQEEMQIPTSLIAQRVLNANESESKQDTTSD